MVLIGFVPLEVSYHLTPILLVLADKHGHSELAKVGDQGTKFWRLLNKVIFFTNKGGLKMWFSKPEYHIFMIRFHFQAHLSTFYFWCTRIITRVKLRMHQKSKVLKWAWKWNLIMKIWYSGLENHIFSPPLLVKKMTLFSKRQNFVPRSPMFASSLWPSGLTKFCFLGCKWKIIS